MKKKKTTKKTKASVAPRWNLKLLYSSPIDPAIEKDAQELEKLISDFSSSYDTAEKKFLVDPEVLLQALADYEYIYQKVPFKGLLYFYYLRDTEASNSIASANISLFENRIAKASNKIAFFEVLLGTISKEFQKLFLADVKLQKFKVFLERVFFDATYNLTVPEEKIMNLKNLPAYDLWVSANEKILNSQTVAWKGKQIPVAEALQTIHILKTSKERLRLATATQETLKKVAPFAEAEINAIFTNKKINDELRGYRTPYENTVFSYRNDPHVVEHLVDVVTKHFSIANRFFKIKARLLKQKRLNYSDRGSSVGDIKTKYPFKTSIELLSKVFHSIDPKYSTILESFIRNGQVDATPRVGKRSGAYCWGSYENPTFVLLNHTDDLRSLSTFAHEMGHAFHTELSRVQPSLYSHYSMSLAETASTLFEAIATESVFDTLSDKEKIVILHDNIQESISTIFRQIACFNYEKDLHETIRTKGYISKEEIADMHNKHMQAYLGPVFKLVQDDGYMFVHWMHLRYFFYVYSYAYGELVSKALLRRYRQDATFWTSIEKYLSAGGKDSPENILKEIGIDVSQPDFWMEGLKEIEEDIIKLEKLTKK